MHGQPVAAGRDGNQAVGDTAWQQDPVTGAELDPLLADLQHGGAGQEGDPLVLVLEVLLRGDVRPAQDLLDHDVGEGQDLLNALAGGGDVGPRPQRASEGRMRNGLVGVVLADDGAAAPAEAAAAVIAGANGTHKDGDEQDEKKDLKHVWILPPRSPLESPTSRFIALSAGGSGRERLNMPAGTSDWGPAFGPSLSTPVSTEEFNHHA